MLRELFGEFAAYCRTSRGRKSRRLVVLADVLLYSGFVLAIFAAFIAAAFGKLLPAVVLVFLALFWLVVGIPVVTDFEQWIRNRYGY